MGEIGGNSSVAKAIKAKKERKRSENTHRITLWPLKKGDKSKTFSTKVSCTTEQLRDKLAQYCSTLK